MLFSRIVFFLYFKASSFVSVTASGKRLAIQWILYQNKTMEINGFKCTFIWFVETNLNQDHIC